MDVSLILYLLKIKSYDDISIMGVTMRSNLVIVRNYSKNIYQVTPSEEEDRNNFYFFFGKLKNNNHIAIATMGDEKAFFVTGNDKLFVITSEGIRV